MRRVYHKPDVCMSCRLCEVYCLTAHSESQNVLFAYKKERPKVMARTMIETLGPVSCSVQCRHCEEPVCVEACMTGAMQKLPSGEVICDTEKCVGCWMCIMTCPFGVIDRNFASEEAKSSKCDLCINRPIPACVENCPNRALIFEDK